MKANFIISTTGFFILSCGNPMAYTEESVRNKAFQFCDQTSYNFFLIQEEKGLNPAHKITGKFLCVGR